MTGQLPAAILLSAIGLTGAAAAPLPGKGAATISAYLSKAPARQFFLPQGLDEISGLAVASSDSVYAHNDENGIVYEIELGTGKVVRAFALGKPTAKGDFEDIAVRGGYVYLLTSDGRVFEAPLGEHRKRVLYNVYDTGVGVHCETEGLATGPKDDDLLILCKQPHDAALKDHLVMYLWSVHDRSPVASPWLNVPLDGLVAPLQQANFHPSAFYWRRERGTFVIISAKSHAAIEIDQQGRLIDRVKLDKQDHPQPEGLTMMPDGRLILSDEGARGHAKISIYAPPH